MSQYRSFNPEHLFLFQQLNTQMTVLTPNRRLSATLHKLYQSYRCQNLAESAWETPDILPISSWIERTWVEYTHTADPPFPLLLNAVQEQYLWEKIILNAKESDQLLQITETAQIAKSAWGLLKNWRVDLENPIFYSALDYRAFHAWITEFNKILMQRNWLDQNSLPEKLNLLIQKQQTPLPKQLALIGFTELTPLYAELMASCQSQGVEIILLDEAKPSETKNKKIVRTDISEADNEIIAIANWAKQLHQQNPEATIGCVIPTLETMRDRVLQVFTTVFAKEGQFTLALNERPFNISAGIPLAHYPIIHTALLLLGLFKTTLNLETFTYLLNSPFLGDAEVERMARCQYDKVMRRENVNYIDLKIIDSESQALSHLALKTYCPKLANRFAIFLTLLPDTKAKKTNGEWAILFNELLTSLGWPGERSLNSQEYQIVEAWLNLLNDYTGLDQVAPSATYEEALYVLIKTANKAMFQPKTPDAPIQVLGLLEAAAIPFDYLWIAGLDDIAWPPSPKPNPFIPKKLQRELKMPHATAERELYFCTSLTKGFIHSAGEIVFSHAVMNGDLLLQPSPLIKDYSYQALAEFVSYHDLTIYNVIFAKREIETLQDESAPPIQGSYKIPGGINVIKQQAMCPFRAFAEWRLYAESLDKPLPGLRSKDRGTIIHKILEIIWNELQDQATLNKMAHADLNEIIDRGITTALQNYPHTRNHLQRYLALEKMRLNKLINEWLDLERTRAPFKIAGNEKALELSVGALQFSLRIDRIDELEDGTKLIIDYKTGKSSEISHWFSDRPQEPQLPLYSLSNTASHKGVAFAQVVAGEVCFKGVSADSTEIKGIKTVNELKLDFNSWQELLMGWQVTLEKLSADFQAGVAKVDPKNQQQTCLYCAIKPLCRINEEIGSK